MTLDVDWNRLPFGSNKDLNTTTAIFMRSKLEDMMCKKRNEKISYDQGMELVDCEDFHSKVPNPAHEARRMFAFWDAVLIPFSPNLGHIF